MNIDFSNNTIAVAVEFGMIAPRYRRVRQFFLTTLTKHDNGSIHRSLEKWVTWNPDQHPERSEWLSKMGVSLVLCGGIHKNELKKLVRSNINVYWGASGPMEQAIQSWLENPGSLRQITPEQLTSGCYGLPQNMVPCAEGLKQNIAQEN